jgi:hypothetical protein
MQTVRIVAVVFVLALMVGPAPADQQQVAPGTGQQNSIVIDTGPDGICNSPAADGDIQLAALGSGSPNRTEIRCGANKLVETIATGDDVQLIAFGAACKNANNAVVDTGEDGIANAPPCRRRRQVIADRHRSANTPCVIAARTGWRRTGFPLGDDVQQLAAGPPLPTRSVVLCGPNLVADTTANNVPATTCR